MKKLIITGASGFLGWNIANSAKDIWDVYGIVFSHVIKIPGVKIIEADLRNTEELKELFKKISPHGVIHTAAITNPNYCELNEKETKKINVDVPLHMASLCGEYNIPFAFTSTDLVFDGLHAPYREEDTPSPVSIYGEQKISAEEGIKQIYPDVAICRMPLIFGIPGPAASSFIQPMIKDMKEGRPLNLFTDEFRTPVSGSSAAEGLLLALEHVKGLIHLGGIERISRYDMGILLKDILGFSNVRLVPKLQRDIIMAAQRPKDVSLDSSKARKLGFKPYNISDELKKIKKELLVES
ncbi:MAG TPA: NAD(P)-dependent oxidoreductase [Candidatus Eremiobacteraeota bacterium]|nr:MAG: dTDP-4-dehydrorhamnose reductase [bacterium ADurb.Bin363]HPZ08898.1 NAD(P)-dependent oxidoreductase [Candidatus Eremiobacteraeota bacterium]